MFSTCSPLRAQTSLSATSASTLARNRFSAKRAAAAFLAPTISRHTCARTRASGPLSATTKTATAGLRAQMSLPATAACTSAASVAHPGIRQAATRDVCRAMPVPLWSALDRVGLGSLFPMATMSSRYCSRLHAALVTNIATILLGCSESRQLTF